MPSKKTKLKRILDGLSTEQEKVQVDFEDFDRELASLKESLRKEVVFSTLDSVTKTIDDFKKGLDINSLSFAVEGIREKVENSLGEITGILESRIEELNQSVKDKDFERDNHRMLTTEIDYLNDEVNRLKSFDITPLLSEVKQESEDKANAIEQVLSQRIVDTTLKIQGTLSVMGDKVSEVSKEVRQLDEKIESKSTQLAVKMAHQGGGAMNRQIKVNGVDVLKNYTDINLTGSITATKDTANKRVNIAFSGGDLSGYVPYTGATSDLDLGTNDLALTGTISVAQATTGALIIGDVTGNTRGTDSIDIQTDRAFVTQVVSGGNSVGLGKDITIAGGDSIGIGSNNTVSGDFSAVIGASGTASGDYSVAMGYNAEVTGSNSSGFGRTVRVAGDNATAMGIGSTSSGYYSTSVGAASTSSADYCTTVGAFVSATGPNSIAVGFNSLASGAASQVIGYGSTASGDLCGVIGFNITNSTTSSFEIGPDNSAKVRITSGGFDTINLPIKPATLTNAAAPNNSIFYSSTNSKLVYKDAGGTVNNLY